MDAVAALEEPAGATGGVVAPDVGARPTALLPISQLVRISLYWLGLTSLDAAVGQFVGFRLNYTDLKGDLGIGAATTVLSLGGTLMSIVIQPTVGSISDYTVSRWGRRKPYIVFGSLLDVVFLFAIANSNSLLAIATFVTLFTFSTNVARGPFQGYVPDLVAEPQVGLASSMVGMMQILGNVTGLVLANAAAIMGNLPLALMAVALIELVTMISVVWRVGSGMPPKDRKGRSWTAIAAEAWGTDILKERSYLWLLASRLFFLTGGSILFAYVITFLKNVFEMTLQEAAVTNLLVILSVVLATVVTVVPASRLSDRVGRKPVIYLACGVGGLGAAIAALSPSVPVALIGAGLFGAANAIFLSVDWALMTDIIPRASAGRYMGMSNVATASSSLFAAAIGGIVLDSVTQAFGIATGARAAFLVGVVLFGVAAVLLRPVVEPSRRAASVVAAAPS